MRSPSAHGVLLLAVALASCRDDSTSPPTQPVLPGLLASRHAAEDPPQFSDWSTPVNLGPPINTTHVESGASISKNGRSLYFHCLDCPGNAGGAGLWVSPRAPRPPPRGPPQRLGPHLNTTDNAAPPAPSLDGHP